MPSLPAAMHSAALLLAFAGCSAGGALQSRDTVSDGSATALQSRDTVSVDSATVARLEREARAIASTTGCSGSDGCRTAPVGAKACGGPRTYIVYCAATTDTVKLRDKLAELERVENAYNAKSGMMSTCNLQLPPTAALIGGRCTEKPASP